MIRIAGGLMGRDVYKAGRVSRKMMREVGCGEKDET